MDVKLKKGGERWFSIFGFTKTYTPWGPCIAYYCKVRKQLGIK